MNLSTERFFRGVLGVSLELSTLHLRETLFTFGLRSPMLGPGWGAQEDQSDCLDWNPAHSPLLLLRPLSLALPEVYLGVETCVFSLAQFSHQIYMDCFIP